MEGSRSRTVVMVVVVARRDDHIGNFCSSDGGRAHYENPFKHEE